MEIRECLGEQGWRSGESTRLPLRWPGYGSQVRRQIWVEFVVGSHPCSERFFSGYSGFPLSSKTNISKFQFDLDTEDEEPPCGCATADSHLFILFYFMHLFIYLFIYSFILFSYLI